MEMAHVRYFLALCNERTFTRAAKRCGVAQPSLTQAIKVLEHQLGAPLFQRLRRGAVLTKLGEELRPHFVAIARYVDKIERTARSVTFANRISA